MYEGSLFLYDLPVNRIAAVNLTVISAPLGTTLKEGSLTWNSTSGGNVRTEKIIVESETECGGRERFELEVSVLSCDCHNNGVCQAVDGEVQSGLQTNQSFSCLCQPGYSGRLCEERDCQSAPSLCFTDHCLSSPCPPGLSCQSLGSTYHCNLLSDPCASSPCYPGVQCINVRMGDSTGYVCGLCPHNMTGDGQTCRGLEEQQMAREVEEGKEVEELEERKEVEELEEGKELEEQEEESPCVAGSCYPGVRCREVPGGVRCGACPPGLSGDGLECRDIDDCEPNPCYPGVLCQDNKAPRRGYQCGHCPPGTEGDGMTCRLPPSSLPLLAPGCTRHCR